MIEWGELFKFGVALLAIVEPFGAIPLFIGAMGTMSAPDRARGARIARVRADYDPHGLFDDAATRP